MSARTASAVALGPRRSPEFKGKRTPGVADTPARRLFPGAVNVVRVDMFRNELSGMLGFGCVDAELGTLAVIDSRLSPDVRRDTAEQLLKMLDGRTAPAFAWVPVAGDPFTEDGEQ